MKGPTRTEHYNWIKHSEIPRVKKKLANADTQLDECKQEVELLDVQMLAIGAMNGTKAYEAACRRHLDAKLRIDSRLSALQREKEKLAANLLQLDTTCSNLLKESKASSKCRQEIRQHKYYSGAPQASVSLAFTNARVNTSGTKQDMESSKGQGQAQPDFRDLLPRHPIPLAMLHLPTLAGVTDQPLEQDTQAFEKQQGKSEEGRSPYIYIKLRIIFSVSPRANADLHTSPECSTATRRQSTPARNSSAGKTKSIVYINCINHIGKPAILARNSTSERSAVQLQLAIESIRTCLLYTSPSPRD